MRAFLLILSVLFAGSAHADDKTAIVGTWKLVSVVYEDVVSKERTPVLGEHPKGIQIATPEGRWLALVTAEGRQIPKTDAERARALTDVPLYAGFGISTPEHARAAGELVDGVVVGSRAVEAAEAGADELARFVESLRTALDAAASVA